MATIKQFLGIYPRIAQHSLQPEQATVAHNVKLRNGKIQAWRERKAVGLGVQDAKTVFYQGCCALTWPSCVSVADYVTDFGRLFITGRTERPETFILNDCVPTYYNLGVPAPATAPVVTATHCEGRTASVRSYVYTYVNVFGEESAPSPVSTQVSVCDGDTVEITGLQPPPDGWGITEIWIYRSATAYRLYEVKEQEPLTDFLKIIEIQCTQTSYTDTTLEKYLGPALITREFRVPPKDLRHIAYLRGTGVLTGVTNNMVHFSAPYTPANWPAEYDLTLPFNIVNAVAVGPDYYVSTDSYPYVINGDGACEARKCRGVDDVDTPLPDISCGYAHSAIATPFGMVYSSKDGLVLVMPTARFSILTSKWFSSDDWIRIRPDTVRLAYWRGYIVCVTDVMSFLLEIDGDTYNDMRLGELTTISDSPVDLITTDFGELIMLDDDRLLYQWNAGDTYRPYEWVSRELNLDGDYSPTTAKIRTDGTTLTLLTPWRDVSYTRYIPNENPVRLARLGRHFNYKMKFTGTGDVEFATLGMSELTINKGV